MVELAARRFPAFINNRDILAASVFSPIRRMGNAEEDGNIIHA